MSQKKQVDLTQKLVFENEQIRSGKTLIAGMDEVGRGPLAGPVCVACVILPLDDLIEGVDDSKKVSEKNRKIIAEKIKNKAISYNIQMIDEKIIDKINILEATKLCMKNAIENMSVAPEVVLVDAISKLDVSVPIKGIIKGDAKSYLIGAASILAKVARDEYMEKLSEKYPEYGFERNKGYGTKEHIDALKRIGHCPHHRLTYLKFLEK